MKKTVVYTLLLWLFYLTPNISFSQDTYSLVFNEKGQLLSAPPALLKQKDILNIHVHVGAEFMNNRIFNVYEQYKNAFELLNKTNSEGKVIIMERSGLSGIEAEKALKQVRYEIAVQMYSILTEPIAKKVLQKKFDIDHEVKTVDALRSDTTFSNKNIIPNKDLLIIPKYQFRTRYYGVVGSRLYENMANCNEKEVIITGDWDCNWSFEAVNITILKDDKHDFHKYSFELRELNANYEALTNQIKNNPITVQDTINFKSFRKLETNVLDLIAQETVDKSTPISKGTIEKIHNWGQAKEKEEIEKANKLKTELDKALNEEKRAVLMNAINAVYGSVSNTEEIAIKLLQFVWFSTRKDILSANPLALSDPKKMAVDVKATKDKLQQLNQDLVVINSKINFYENLLNEQQSLCCSNSQLTANINLVQKKFADLLDLKSQKENEIVINQNQLGSLNKLSTKENLITLSATKDSLLYVGEFLINSEKYRSNGKGLAYMRHHNAIEDYQLMGMSPVEEINEEQYVYILAHNEKLNIKLTLKSTVEIITEDLDNFSNQIKAAGTDPNLDNLYFWLKKLLTLQDSESPFKFGFLKYPIHQIEDKIPNLITHQLSHILPNEAPSLVKYEIIDSLKKVNVNSEVHTFNYRFNNLYRFRLKAGFIYSNLLLRDYTIEASTNTASLTTERAGLGGSFGIQIFPSRIDIHKNGLIFKPFIYTGFIFTESPAENFLLGGGFEIINGLALMGGWHIGQTEYLTVRSGALDINTNQTATNWFLSIAVSIPVFDKLFNLNNLQNPFKQP